MFPILEFLKEVFFYSGYLYNNGSFPKPLTPSKEKEYIARYMDGDMEAKDALIEHNLRLVAHIAKKYSSNSAESDDFISIGTVGLIKGINTFNVEKGTSLATYIARCIDNEILMFLRSDKKKSAEISLGEPIGEDKEGNKISLIDIISTSEGDVSEQVELKLQVEKLRGLLGVLNKRELVVINLRYGIGGNDILPQREIAKKLGISRSYLSVIIGIKLVKPLGGRLLYPDFYTQYPKYFAQERRTTMINVMMGQYHRANKGRTFLHTGSY